MTTRWISLVFVTLASFPCRAEIKPPADHEDKGAPKKGGAVAAKVKPSGLCDKLYRFTCAPGEYDDGTGIGRSKDQVLEKAMEIKKEETKAYVDRFRAEIAKNPRLRKVAIGALDLTDSPDCEEPEEAATDEKGKEAEKVKKERCEKTVSDGLADLALDRLFAFADEEPHFNLPGFSLRNMDFLLNNPAFRRIEGELGGKVREKLVDKKSAEKLEKEIFPEVRDSIVSVVEKLVKDPKVRKKITDKVKGIEFGGTDCTNLKGGNEASLMGSLIPNAFYNPVENVFTYCNGFLMQSTSRFQMVHVIAHELSHSFDPCNIALDVEGSAVAYTDPKDIEMCEQEFPFVNVIPCLRDEESVGAKRRSIKDDPLLGGRPGGGLEGLPFPEGLEGGPTGKDKEKEKDRPKVDDKEKGGEAPKEGGKEADKEGGKEGAVLDRMKPGKAPEIASPFCQEDDQVTEAFADRIADEVLPDYIEKNHPKLTVEQKRIGYSNVYRGSCPRKGDGRGHAGHEHDVHPDMQKRVDRSLLVHPKVRKQMGCKEEPPEGRRFCPLEAGDVKVDVKKKKKFPEDKKPEDKPGTKKEGGK